MILTLIAAADENNMIGKDNQLLWNLPADMRHFREKTEGHPVIMGRKTFESIGRPLPNRRNIVITRKADSFDGCEVARSFEEAMEKAKGAREVFVIGGGKVYHQALPYADRIELTRIHGSFPGDTVFPEFSSDEWEEVAREKHEADKEHSHAFTFLTFERREGTKPGEGDEEKWTLEHPETSTWGRLKSWLRKAK